MAKVLPDNALTSALRALEKNSSLNRLLKDLDRYQAIFRAAEGPLAELRRAGAFDAMAPYRKDLQRTQKLLQQFEASFRLPKIHEAAQLMAEYQKSPLAEALQRYQQKTTSLQHAMEKMQTPWLDMQDRLQSINSFVKLQSIGQALAAAPTFDPNLTSALRVDLGDWRERITLSNRILADIQKRAELYRDLGFDPTLTEFPSPTFHEALDIAEVVRDPPPLVVMYGPPVPPSDDEEEEAQLERTNMAHDWLLRLETQIRQFIDDRMKEAFGPNWPKQRLPKDLYVKWRDKKASAESAGARKWPLIAYADFTDYVAIICKRDNWREVFAAYFSRPEDVRESFQRLYPVRLDTMHARPITQDDELLLYVETQRLMKVVL